jgi:prevent-host-death family protein
MVVKTVLISEFKAKCIKMLKEVQKNGKPLTVTLRGEPIARVEPIAKGHAKKRRLGALRGRIIIKGDIIKSDFDQDWEAQ